MIADDSSSEEVPSPLLIALAASPYRDVSAILLWQSYQAKPLNFHTARRVRIHHPFFLCLNPTIALSARWLLKETVTQRAREFMLTGVGCLGDLTYSR